MTDFAIEARGLRKTYGKFEALKGVNLNIPFGRIVGVIGANGAGKTTLLNSILGLATCEGELSVLGANPGDNRGKLMEEVCFISDVATLPRWMSARQVFDYVEGVHPRFNRQLAMDYLAKTPVPLDRKIKKLSKGMIVLVHLSVVMAIDARLLVLDEPTLGLDIIFRKDFYRALLEDYFDGERTILITTHQVEEIENILSDVIFVRGGEVVLADEMTNVLEEFKAVECSAQEHEAALEALGPVAKEGSIGRKTFIFQGQAKETLAQYGTVKRVGLADVFVAIMKGAAK